MNLKGVLIDFGYTLADLNRENVRKYREELVSILTGYGYNKTVEDLAPILDSLYRSTSTGEVKDLYGFWKLLLTNLSMPENQNLISELMELRKRHIPTRWRLYEGVIPVLSDLRNKYKLALVSNCFVGLSDILEALDLPRFFKCIILSYKVGVRKPDKQMYLEALRCLRLESGECIFVSDQISDLEGAREVGLKTLLVRQGEYTTRDAKDPNFKPDYKCNYISEITNFL